MADFETIQNDLTALLATTLTAAGVELVLENSQAGDEPRAPSGEWAEVRVLTAGRIRELASRNAYHRGQMIVEIYTELGQGSRRRAQIEKAIANAFQGKRIGAASCYQLDPRTGARDPGGDFWHSGCSLEFHWEHAPT